MNKMKKIITVAIVGFATIVFSSSWALADPMAPVPVGPGAGASSASADAVCSGINPGGGCTDTSAEVNKMITSIINILTWVVGLVAVIMIIYAGAMIITSNGDSSKVKNGRMAIIFAIVGLIVVALAQVIARFVIQETKK